MAEFLFFCKLLKSCLSRKQIETNVTELPDSAGCNISTTGRKLKTSSVKTGIVLILFDQFHCYRFRGPIHCVYHTASCFSPTTDTSTCPVWHSPSTHAQGAGGSGSYGCSGSSRPSCSSHCGVDREAWSSCLRNYYHCWGSWTLSSHMSESCESHSPWTQNHAHILKFKKSSLKAMQRSWQSLLWLGEVFSY